MARAGDDDVVARIVATLAAYPFGIHQIGPPARAFDTALPAAVQAVVRAMDGATLFHESILVLPAASIRCIDGNWQVGEHCGDAIAVADDDGRVLRTELESGDVLVDGTAFDRWLWGAIDGEATLWDDTGEPRDNLFDDSGELLPGAVCARERKVLKRDRAAPAPRWRLARALWALGDIAAARAQLEQVVEVCPGFGWALFDLARIAESLGEIDIARADLEAAAVGEAIAERAAMFYAHAARLAAAAGDDTERARLAGRALERDPDFARAQKDGARAELAAGRADAARRLLALCLALAPRDVEALAMARHVADEA